MLSIKCPVFVHMQVYVVNRSSQHLLFLCPEDVVQFIQIVCA